MAHHWGVNFVQRARRKFQNVTIFRCLVKKILKLSDFLLIMDRNILRCLISEQAQVCADRKSQMCIFCLFFIFLFYLYCSKPFKSRVRHFFCNFLKVCNSITHQAIELESCSNPLRIQQSLKLQICFSFWICGFLGMASQVGVFLRFFGHLYLALSQSIIFFGN